MAGFRSGRGRGTRGAQQQGQYPPQQAPGQYAPGPGPAPYGGQGRQGRGGHGQGRGPSQQRWPGQGHGEPEYLGDPHGGQGYGPRPAQGPGYGQDPYGNGPSPGSTQAFSVPDPYGPDGGADDWSGGQGAPPPGPPPGPRLHWKELLRGIVLSPNRTFWQMRDYPVWGPAIIVTFLYGLLAVFGLDKAREEVIHATLASAIPYVVTTGIAVVLVGLILGTVTHTLARQFGGDGTWAPTIGLSMLIMSLTDAPRLLFALFLGGTDTFVKVLGWVTWVAAAALFASMVSRSHDIAWPKALGASAIQLIALLALMKLGTL